MEIPEWYVELYPECRPHYRPFGIGYGIYVRVSIRYTTMGHPTHGRMCPSLGRISICDSVYPAGYIYVRPDILRHTECNRIENFSLSPQVSPDVVGQKF